MLLMAGGGALSVGAGAGAVDDWLEIAASDLGPLLVRRLSTPHVAFTMSARDASVTCGAIEAIGAQRSVRGDQFASSTIRVNPSTPFQPPSNPLSSRRGFPIPVPCV